MERRKPLQDKTRARDHTRKQHDKKQWGEQNCRHCKGMTRSEQHTRATQDQTWGARQVEGRQPQSHRAPTGVDQSKGGIEEGMLMTLPYR